MDLSSLSEAQQQQQQPIQQQDQNYASQSYGPAQNQSCEQWYYSYYQQQQQQPQQNEQQQHYAAYYRPPENSTAYQNAPHQMHLQTVSLNQPGVPTTANEGAQIVDTGGAYRVQQQQQQSAFYPGLNSSAAAAVAALSQLAQFAGTMDAAERALAGLQAAIGPSQVHPSGNQFPYKGNGGQGVGPSRGGGLGRGRRNSRGRGVPKRFPQRGTSSRSSYLDTTTGEDEELTDQKKTPSAVAPEASSVPATAPEKVEASRKAAKAAWCEICRVECTSLEILEQHKNGKRHKKNLVKIEELRKAIKPMSELENEQKHVADSEPKITQQLNNSQGGEVNKLAENLPVETVLNNMEKQPEVSMNESSDLAEGNSNMSQFSNRTRGMKRKMRGGRGGKRLKSFEGSRQQMESPQPKVVIPLICDLCNVKCDTQEVLDCHLSGKKHIAKLKRFEGHQATYGPTGIQALYPPNPLAQTLFHPQTHQQPPVCSQGSNPPTGAYVQVQSQSDQSQQYHPTAQAESTVGLGGQI